MRTIFEDKDTYESVESNVGSGTVIKIFDFDGTLFNSPIPNRNLWDRSMFGKLMGETKNGGYGWFQNPRTLEDRYIGNSDFNEDVVAEVRKATTEQNTVTVMLTGRTINYENMVKRILDSNDLTFDHYGFKPIGKGVNIFTMNFKQEFIRDLVSLYGDVTSIEMWEDRNKHVDRFNDFLDTLELNGGVHFVKEDERYMDESLERELVELLRSDARNSTAKFESSNNKAPIYYGAFLNPASHYELLEVVKDQIPEGWKTYAHHMTILFGNKKNEEVEAYLKSNMGKDVYVDATSIGISNDAIAVKVESDVPSDNAIPHITVAVPIGGKPFNSNFITDWTFLDSPLRLKAKINAFYG